MKISNTVMKLRHMLNFVLCIQCWLHNIFCFVHFGFWIFVLVRIRSYLYRHSALTAEKKMITTAILCPWMLSACSLSSTLHPYIIFRLYLHVTLGVNYWKLFIWLSFFLNYDKITWEKHNIIIIHCWCSFYVKHSRKYNARKNHSISNY